MKRRWACDLEATGLMDDQSIDYRSIPYKLKDDFRVHCIGLVDLDSEYEILLDGADMIDRFKKIIHEETEMIIFHNGINYDLMVLKLFAGMDFDILPDILDGANIKIEDSLVLSKVLNPDRFGGHSLDEWGRRLKFPKIDWRSEAIQLGLIEWNSPRGAEFQIYHPKMGEYCLQDCRLTKRLYDRLMWEWGDWSWQDPYDLEKKVKHICTMQEHRGFWLDIDLCKESIKELDALMEERRAVIEPLLPLKPTTKTALKAATMNPEPFKKDIITKPPVNQFLKSGEPNKAIKRLIENMEGTLEKVGDDWVATIEGESYTLPLEKSWITKGEPDANAFKFCHKHGGQLWQEGEEWVTELYGKRYTLPILEPVIPLEIPATMADTTHIKNWLVGLGWEPKSWSEKDLTVNAKKQKLKRDKYEEAVERYLESTLGSNFADARIAHLKTSRQNLRKRLLDHDMEKPLKVLTNPDFTVGQEKEICPNLAKMPEFPYAEEMAHYLTYRHRRNAILGGGVAWDDDDEMEKGYLGHDRGNVDHRISTPADTCGTNTSRMKHKKVANVPRTISLYGKKMRALFGCDPDCYQLGYDADSLEANIEAHYCWRYDPTKDYCNSLTQPKPNDCHTVLAGKLTDMLGFDFPRDSAKQVKYACAYGAQPYRLSVDNGWDMPTAEAVFNGYWEAADPLAQLKDHLTRYWETTGEKKFILGIDGRKIPVRSKHSLVNALFQSGGVICMKRAMVIHHERLKKKGLIIDFFKDDWTKTSYVQQMIAYHDEAQEELTKDLVKFHMFKTKDEAKAFELPDRILGDVQEAPDGRFFRAWCESGESASQSLTEASRYYKLNVELTAGYVIGKNWRDCH